MGLRRASLAAWAAVAAVGVFAAWPFFNRGLVGTGEAFNYSLSVADALAQMRAGIVPPLAGQTEFAFNGRIHPLRNAPYLYYLCEGIDLATFHRLPFWEVQNFSLVISIFGALFACYGGLRWATGCPRALAVFLSAAYALGPPLMGAAHTFDLFMTVHAAVFVPLALAACVKGCRTPSFSSDAWLAAALAAAWLAHPPVAFWLTSSVIFVRIVAFAGNPSAKALASGVAAAALGILLSGFVFVSVATLSSDLGYFSDKPEVWGHFPDVIVNSLRGAFPGMLLPVSAGAGNLSDLQIGYVSLGLMVLSLVLALRRSPQDEPGAAVRLSSLGCALAALGLVVMDLPVPFVTHWAWRHVPTGALQLTTEWPMQRLYLVATGLTVFAAGMILPAQWRTLRAPRWLAPSLAVLATGWLAYQAKPFLARGISNRWTPEATLSAFRPSNLDLTVTSYAFLGLPPTYVHGVQDPRFEFRILRDGVDDIASPLAAGLANAPIVQKGSLKFAGGMAPGKLAVSPKLRLSPGHRYLLSFAFRVPPVDGLLYLKGPLLNRGYVLPQAGEAYGFGMMDGQQTAIPVWTDSVKAEDVEIRLWISDRATVSGKPAVFADYALQDVDMSTLPVRLESLLPLRFTVDAPQAGCTVETPRRFLTGYAATVNGKAAAVLMSPYRQAMIPLPAGRSVVELSYPGPWRAHLAFWVSVICWLGFFAWRAGGSPVPSRQWTAAPVAWAWRHRWAVAAAIAIAAVVSLEFRKRAREDAVARAVGPVRVDFYLPYGRRNVSEPLLATGKVGAGVVVFAHYIDATHISIGADVWGSLFTSPPIDVDYSALQTLVVSDGALFPRDNPTTKELSPTEERTLRHELRVELNGNLVINKAAETFESKPEEILAGRTTFGSLTEPEFKGRIVGVERLPIPRILMLPASMHARLDVSFPPADNGATEPLLDVLAGPDSSLLSVTYLSPGRARFSLVGRNGSRGQSAEASFDPARSHEMDIRPVAGGQGDGPLTLSCTMDGAQLLGAPGMKPAGNVPILQSGLTYGPVAGVRTRFYGAQLKLAAVPDPGWIPPGQDWGMEVLVVTFPKNKDGRHEPILTSGVTGAGDLIYVVYKDDRHVTLGLDHWNGSVVASEPIAVAYDEPHEFWISSGPLYPDNPATALSAADRKRLVSQIRVALDGRTVILASKPAYPSAPSQVTVGSNRIGGSTADPVFSGVIHYSGRMDPKVVSW